MNISDIRTRVDALNERSCLVTRDEREETPVLTLVDSADRSDASDMPDPLIQALVDKLPRPKSIWSIDDRAKWLKAAAMIFNLVYTTEPGDTLKHNTEEQVPSAPFAESKSVA